MDIWNVVFKSTRRALNDFLCLPCLVFFLPHELIMGRNTVIQRNIKRFLREKRKKPKSPKHLDRSDDEIELPFITHRKWTILNCYLVENKCLINQNHLSLRRLATSFKMKTDVRGPSAFRVARTSEHFC